MDQPPPVGASLRERLSRRSILLGLGAVGAFLAVDLGAVAWANDWIRPASLTRASFIDAFRTLGGVHLGFRKNHAKGVAVTGYFESSGAAAEFSSAAVFAAGRTPLTGRFSMSGPNPGQADTASTARGLGLAIGFPGGEQWRTAMVNLPVFPVRTPAGFYAQLFASNPDPVTGKPDPKAMAAFQAAHPESVAATAIIKAHPPSPGFADSVFACLNAFYLVDGTGRRTPVRWTLAPAQKALPAGTGPNGLFDPLVRQLRAGPLRWSLRLTLGEPGDPVDDATLPWPPQRRVVDAGTIVLDTVETERAGNARDVNFDPTVLPAGMTVSDDPLLSARSAVYAASYRARTGEPKSPSPVQVDQVTP